MQRPELVLNHKQQTRTLLPELPQELPPEPQGFNNIHILPTTFMVALHLQALGDEVDPALWLDQVLVTCHTLHLQAGSLQAKASRPDLVVQVHGATHHFLRVPVVPLVLKLPKYSGLHPSTPHRLKSQNLLPLDPVQTSPGELPQQSQGPMLKQQDSLPWRQLLQ